MNRGEAGFDVHGAAWRRMALALAMRPDPRLHRHPLRLVEAGRRRHALFASGQVFASVGNSAVNVYSQASGNPLITRLNDGSNEPLHRRQRLRFVAATSTSPTT